MILGSYNSMTYLHSNIFYNLISFIWRTQNNDIIKQFNNGVRYFDLHITTHNNNWVFCRWFVKFKQISIITILNLLNKLAVMSEETIYVKLTLELNKDKPEIQNKFRELCDTLKNKYSQYITFLNGMRYFDDACLYRFENEEPFVSFNKKEKPDILLKKFC